MRLEGLVFGSFGDVNSKTFETCSPSLHACGRSRNRWAGVPNSSSFCRQIEKNVEFVGRRVARGGQLSADVSTESSYCRGFGVVVCDEAIKFPGTY